MIMTEADRLAMMETLQPLGRGLWVEIQSQLQQGGLEMPLWVLVATREAIPPALEVILDVTRPFREAAGETAVSITFDEFRDGRLFHWNHLEPDEVRTGQLLFELGEEAVERGTENSVYEAVHAHVQLLRRMRGTDG